MLRKTLGNLQSIVAVGWFFATIAAGPANADPIKVSADRSTELNTFGTATKSCHHTGKPKAKILQAPKHGTITFKWVSATYEDVAWARGCYGKPTKLMSIIYTPNPGYRGTDYAKVGFTFHPYANRAETEFSPGEFHILVR